MEDTTVLSEAVPGGWGPLELGAVRSCDPMASSLVLRLLTRRRRNRARSPPMDWRLTAKGSPWNEPLAGPMRTTAAHCHHLMGCAVRRSALFASEDTRDEHGCRFLSPLSRIVDSTFVHDKRPHLCP